MLLRRSRVVQPAITTRAAFANCHGRDAVLRPSRRRLGTRKTRVDAAARHCAEQEELNGKQDWRDFRAQLVNREKLDEAGVGSDAGLAAAAGAAWAFETPMIEKGSLVLSAVGDRFALTQQYLHKALALVIQHDENGAVGLILNRPTALTSDDFDLDIAGEADSKTPVAELAQSRERAWRVWFGGDCQGVNQVAPNHMPLCLHTERSLAEFSDEVVKGIFLIDFWKARDLVSQGLARGEDFVLFLGYLAWMPGHLQSEVDRGDSWIAAAVDSQMLIELLRKAQASSGCQPDASCPQALVDNGIAQWQQFYAALGPRYEQRWAQFRSGDRDAHVDAVLGLWIKRCLLTPRTEGRPRQTGVRSVEAGEATPQSLKGGTILTGSPEAWSLGRPSEEEDFFSHFRPTSWRPHQYLHKAVLLLLQDVRPGERSVLLLLNGPRLRQSPDGQGSIFLGGTRELGKGEVFELGSGTDVLRVEGFISFRPGILEKLLSLDALAVATGVTLEDMVSAPTSARWEAAGGIVDSSMDVDAVAIGDAQKQLWFNRFFGRAVDVDG